MAIKYGFDPRDGTWKVTDPEGWNEHFKVGGDGFGVFGKYQTQVVSMPSVVVASYGAVASLAGEVAVADFNNAVGSLTYMINSVGNAVGTIQNLLRLFGLMA